MLFHRALPGGPYHGGSVLLRKFFGELDLHGDFFDPVRCFIPLDGLFQANPLRIDVPGFAELKDVVSGAGSQRGEEKVKGSGRSTVSTVLPGLVGVDGEGIEMGVYPGSTREINGNFHKTDLSFQLLMFFLIHLFFIDFGRRPVSVDASAAAGSAVRGSKAAAR